MWANCLARMINLFPFVLSLDKFMYLSDICSVLHGFLWNCGSLRGIITVSWTSFFVVHVYTFVVSRAYNIWVRGFFFLKKKKQVLLLLKVMRGNENLCFNNFYKFFIYCLCVTLDGLLLILLNENRCLLPSPIKRVFALMKKIHIDNTLAVKFGHHQKGLTHCEGWQ